MDLATIVVVFYISLATGFVCSGLILMGIGSLLDNDFLFNSGTLLGMVGGSLWLGVLIIMLLIGFAYPSVYSPSPSVVVPQLQATVQSLQSTMQAMATQMPR